jgi:SAM-dependent methyltransferase
MHAMTVSGEVDWAARWRVLHEARSEQQARRPGTTDDIWGARSERFARMIDSANASRDLVGELVRPHETLLDVGAGAGRYAIPLSTRVREVLAVEPSAGMGQRLRDEAQRRGRDNVRVITSDWFSAQVSPADVVLCAHVLYFVREVEAFVRKLDEHARRLCVIVIRVDQMLAPLNGLYEEIWGEPLAPEPSFIELYNLLFDRGIVPEVAIRPGGRGQGRYESLEQAEAEVSNFLSVSDAPARARIRAFLKENLQPSPGGLFVLGRGGREAVLSWSKN